MTSHLKLLFLVSLIFVYFGVAWFFPWETIQIDSTVSVSYLWDVCFSLLIGFLFHLSPRGAKAKGLWTRSLAIFLLAVLSIGFLRMVAYPVPFRYLELPILQLLVLAPLFEELVFRYAILGGLLKELNSKNKALLASSFLFSLSHLPGAWHLPPEFTPFIMIQLVYTFAMGWVIGKARVRTGGILEPVALHFLFNLCFYASVLQGWI